MGIEDILLKWLTDAPFWAVLALVLFLFMKQNRDTQREQNSINAVQAENQNSLISQVAPSLSSLKDLLEKRFTDDDTRANELHQVVQDNTTATKARTQAAIEQAQSLDRLAASMNNVGTDIKAAFRESNADVVKLMQARAAGTDTQLSSIHAGVNAVNSKTETVIAALDRQGAIIDTLPPSNADQTKMLDEIGKKLDELPADLKDDIQEAVKAALGPIADSLARLADALEKKDAAYRDQIVKLQENVQQVLDKVAMPFSHQIAQFAPSVVEAGEGVG